MKGHEFQSQFTIDYQDVDKNQNLKIPNLIDMCNNTSTKQSETLRMGLDFLEKHQAAWIFCKLKVRLDRIPYYKETITINTYSVGSRKYFASRNFEILDSNKKQIGLVEGLYCLIDTISRRPMVIPEEHMKAYGTLEEVVLLKDLRLKQLDTYDFEEEFKVRFFDIDTNGHTNSGIYPTWALESLPLKYHDNKILKELSIIYEKEVLLDEKVTVKTKLENNQVSQVICNAQGKSTTLLESVWTDK